MAFGAVSSGGASSPALPGMASVSLRLQMSTACCRSESNKEVVHPTLPTSSSSYSGSPRSGRLRAGTRVGAVRFAPAAGARTELSVMPGKQWLVVSLSFSVVTCPATSMFRFATFSLTHEDAVATRRAAGVSSDYGWPVEPTHRRRGLLTRANGIVLGVAGTHAGQETTLPLGDHAGQGAVAFGVMPRHPQPAERRVGHEAPLPAGVLVPGASVRRDVGARSAGCGGTHAIADRIGRAGSLLLSGCRRAGHSDSLEPVGARKRHA